jgi:hypothetical protein
LIFVLYVTLALPAHSFKEQYEDSELNPLHRFPYGVGSR